MSLLTITGVEYPRPHCLPTSLIGGGGTILARSVTLARLYDNAAGRAVSLSLICQTQLGTGVHGCTTTHLVREAGVTAAATEMRRTRVIANTYIQVPISDQEKGDRRETVLPAHFAHPDAMRSAQKFGFSVSTAQTSSQHAWQLRRQICRTRTDCCRCCC